MSFRKYRVIGDLTINNVTKPLSIDLELNGTAADPYGNERVGFEGSAEILRSEGGLTCNAVLEAGGVMISDKVKLNFDISAIETVGGCQDPARRPPSARCWDPRFGRRRGRLRRPAQRQGPGAPSDAVEESNYIAVIEEISRPCWHSQGPALEQVPVVHAVSGSGHGRREPARSRPWLSRRS
ncbi:hypothetical protein SSP24_29260 [Streptomyces spinoverrucosus]|uniref:Lipid/polyisoprenoid-binding YceI-like domain-containing protein n=1 Tax=Streptomyces spinoverrucosus TaxID=284043 RepID=A0A4Y3VHY2_9ACTN|nr:hypothetical protein SSP24_29260 [Streptomyces spinoverrucosus]GHB79473.1 hypothetical protein GCM10010397_57780 [Streptomyces spinoverrucosus]